MSLKSWIITVIHKSAEVVKFKSVRNSGLNVIRTQDLCDTSAVLYQLSSQANWELFALQVSIDVFKFLSAVQIYDLS